MSLGTIAGVIQKAERRALLTMAAPVAVGPRVLALDEISGNNRHGATLSVVDALSGAVWAAAGPVAVDGESWTLLLWAVQARGLRWNGTVSDGGLAMQQACASVAPEGQHQRDVWHVLHTCGQVQARLDRWVRTLEAQTATVARQAARAAAGGRARGKPPRTDMAAHAALVAHAQASAVALAYLTDELRRLLGVVVLTPTGLLRSPPGVSTRARAPSSAAASMTPPPIGSSPLATRPPDGTTNSPDHSPQTTHDRRLPDPQHCKVTLNHV